MYQVTITREGNVYIQDIFNEKQAKDLWNVFEKNAPWNIVVLKLEVNGDFRPKEDFI